jgi:hypothetical protein
MAYFHLTASGAVNKLKTAVPKVKVTVNATLTGTITLSDETGTAGTPVVAIITNPTVGSVYEYWDLQTGLTINPSATCEITVNTSSFSGAK